MDPRMEQQKNYPRAMQSYVYMLYEFVLEMKPKNILEIGTQNGQSTKSMLMAMNQNKTGRLLSIDHKTRNTILDAEYPDLKPYCTFFQSDSHKPEALRAAKEFIGDEQFDILFIDGDHKMPGVKQDFDDYSQLVKPGGVIILHDIINQNEDVWQLWEQINWEKFAINWGRARNNVVPGIGLVRKPYDI